MNWLPNIGLSTYAGFPVYKKLLEALKADIDRGALEHDDLLPPQRKLASALGISLGTVARFYREAEAKGLVEGHVGRGTRVTMTGAGKAEEVDGYLLMANSDHARSSQQVIDLSRNEPPKDVSAIALEQAVKELDYINRLRHEVGYAPVAGRIQHRELYAEWLVRNDVNVSWNQTVMCHGAHHALSLALDAIVSEDSTIIVEDNTYFGFLTLAQSRNLQLVPVATDEEGPIPENLEALTKKHKRPILYLMPSMQNPTLRSISLERRNTIVAIARDHQMYIIEDDVNRPLVQERHEPLLHLAPDLTLHISSLSKAVAPALRAGCLAATDPDLLDRVTKNLKENGLAGTSTSMSLAATMLKTGLADVCRDQIVEDSLARLSVVEDIFGDRIPYRSAAGAQYIWLPMPLEKAERVCYEAMQSAIALTPPSTVSLNLDNSGLRICVGACELGDLQSSLSTLRACLL